MATLNALLLASAQLHHHLCPRQVLGVRMGLLAGRVLGLELPQAEKRLLAIVETDGCLTSGIAVATNCWVNHRTMRIEDYGKVAATFVDTHDGRAIRVAPRPSARGRAIELLPEAPGHWEAMLSGYQKLADEELLSIQAVSLATPVGELISHAGQRVICAACGEEIINGREMRQDGVALCRACGQPAYYQLRNEVLAGWDERSAGCAISPNNGLAPGQALTER